MRAVWATVLSGVVTPIVMILWQWQASAPIVAAGGPVFTLGLMGVGMIAAAAAGQFWRAMILALLNGGSLLALALSLGKPGAVHPLSMGLAFAIAAISFTARGALFSKTLASRGWLMALFVVAGEASVLLIVFVLPGFLPDWFLALLPAQWASIAIQSAITGPGIGAAVPVLVALAGTAATTLLAAKFWLRGWPYPLMFTTWLAVSALVYFTTALH